MSYVAVDLDIGTPPPPGSSVIVALNQAYGRSLDTGSEIATLLLGVLLWPILATGGDVAIAF